MNIKKIAKTLLTLIIVVVLSFVSQGVARAEEKTLPLRQAIGMLVETKEHVLTKYDRRNFPHWEKSLKYPGCNIRYEVLIDEGKGVSVSKGCYVSGKWVSYYDRETFTDPRKLDIDHMVPLHEAWKSGAYAWSAEKRKKYANDTHYPYTLVAVSAGSNRSKGDKDPSSWMPTYNKCRYIAEWVGVKLHWGLTVDPVEKKVLQTESKNCKNRKIKIK
jgi:hypothetical protein